MAEVEAQPGVFLRAEWRQLAMLNYEVDPQVVRPFLPNGTELDLWRGRAYVSVVGFLFLEDFLRRLRFSGCLRMPAWTSTALRLPAPQSPSIELR